MTISITSGSDSTKNKKMRKLDFDVQFVARDLGWDTGAPVWVPVLTHAKIQAIKAPAAA